MNKTTIPTYSSKKYTYKILGDLTVSVEIKNNPYELAPEQLFEMASRINRKRGFLFVSKILGKHIPITPEVGLLGGALLASRFLAEIYQQDVSHQSELLREGITVDSQSAKQYQAFIQNRFELPDDHIFIGFAETATAIGYSMFAAFQNNARYIHTTREMLRDYESIISFEEEHSHATSHRFYAKDRELLKGSEPIVLVDDEITTGKTALNIIRELQAHFPRQEYVLASLLDWRSDEDRAKFREAEKELGIRIRSISLLEGRYAASGNPPEDNLPYQYLSSEVTTSIETICLADHFFEKLSFPSVDSLGDVSNHPYLLETGRFGIGSGLHDSCQQAAKEIGTLLQQYRISKEGQVLCLGTGEFMYLPMLISTYMGNGVKYHSTTRSPVYACDKQGYGVKTAFSFDSPDDPTIRNYMYNIPYGHYENAFVFIERAISDERLASFKQQLERLGIPRIYLVVCSSR